MLRSTTEQRRTLIDKIPDAANLALGALVFAQFVADRPFSTSVAIGGLTVWTALVACALLLGGRR